MSLKGRIFFFLGGSGLFLLTGLVWLGLFSVLGMTSSSPTDLTYWKRQYDALTDVEAETVLIEHLTLLTPRLTERKHCFLRKSKKMIRVIKHGCPSAEEEKKRRQEEIDGVSEESYVKANLAQASQLVQSKKNSAARIASELSGGRSDAAASFSGDVAGKNEAPRQVGRGVAISRRLRHEPNPPWWHGPALLDPWRNVGGKRMRAGWKYESRSNTGTIFVSIVSFRDRRCPDTLFELFSKAQRPDRINVGVVQQNAPEDVDCFTTYCKRAGDECRPDNVRIVRMPAHESRGVMVVRNMASSLFEGEQYFLQLDAHNLFTSNWDQNLIEDLGKVKNNERVVLSHHPPAIDSLRGWGKQAINICKYEWDGNGLPRFSANVVNPPSSKPFPGVFIGAGMVFARSEILIDCPFDRHLPFLFSGEELLLAACAWSHGWDIYNPSVAPVFHFYKGGSKGDVSINPVNDRVHSKSLKRLKYALGVKGTFDSLPEGEFREDFDIFAMGSARRLDEYYKYAGIDWEKRDKNWPFCTFHDKSFYKYHNFAVQGLPPLNQLSYDKGVTKPDPAYPVLKGDALKSEKL